MRWTRERREPLSGASLIAATGDGSRTRRASRQIVRCSGTVLYCHDWIGMKLDLLDLLLDHDRWATAQLLEASCGLSDDDLDREFDIGHRTLRETFGHMIFNVPFWT